MAIKEQLEKEFTNSQEWRKGILSIFLALLGGEGIMLYALISGEKPVVVWILFVLGLLAIIAMTMYLGKINDEIEEIIEKIGDI